jgi:hypothetical protein
MKQRSVGPTAYLELALTAWLRNVIGALRLFVKRRNYLPGKLDVCGSVHHTIINIKIQQVATVYQSFISYLYVAQHVSGDTPPIIRSLKLYSQPLVLHTWRVVGRVVAGQRVNTRVIYKKSLLLSRNVFRNNSCVLGPNSTAS